jgi:hypothetical protein
MLRLGSRSSGLRRYATVVGGQPKAPLSGLSDAVKERAEALSEWKGTSATGQKTKNYIGGEFVESQASEWLDVVDPVESSRCTEAGGSGLTITTVHTDASYSCSGNDTSRVRPSCGRCFQGVRDMASNQCPHPSAIYPML